MNTSSFVYFRTIVLLCIWKFIYASGMNYIPETWIDPTDMRYYDRCSKSMRPNRSSPSVKDVNENEQNMAPKVEGKLLCTKDEVERCEIFVERFINIILLAANLKNRIPKPGTKIISEIPVRITSEELGELISLSEEITSSRLNELDELFSKILKSERGFSFDILMPYLNPLQQLFYNLTLEKITIIIFMVLSSVVLWMFAVGKTLRRIILFVFLTFFMAGLAWNWWSMYQEAVIEQYAEMKKMSAIPDICMPKKVSLLGHFFLSSNKDECKKYHKSFQMNPFAKIPPTVVLSETVSSMLVHPLRSTGSAIGEFLVGVNSAASWPLNILFLPFVFLTFVGFILFTVILCLNIDLRFWSWFGGITINGDAKTKDSYQRRIADENDLKQTIELENDRFYILTQVGTVKKLLSERREELKFTVGPSGDTNGDIFSNSLIHNSVVEERVQNESCNRPFCDDQSNSILELFRYIPRQRINSLRTVRKRPAICKKKYK